MVTTTVSPREIVKSNLCESLIRTNLAKINFCENYITYRIRVPKRYVTYMGRNIHLLRSVYYESFVTRRYIWVSEVGKKT